MIVTNKRSTLVISAMLMSFVEMMLIRWTSSNIYSLFFFTNFILIASFLGIGIGFLRAKKATNYFYLSPVLLSIVVLFCYLYSYEYNAVVNPLTGNLNYYGKLFKDHTYPVLLTLPIIFIAVAITMAAIADLVAKEFGKFPSLQAYRLEILGTLGGIVAFAALSFLESPPLIWGIVIIVLYGVLLPSSFQQSKLIITIAQISALMLILAVFYKETMTENHKWSTYYKIQIKEYLPQSYVVNVNGLAQQVIESVEQRIKKKPFYLKPYQHIVEKAPLNDVLVIGAGTGGDVAIALAQGAKHIDAVEIDPALYAIGKRLNPSKPYNNPHVSVHINDGRAFLQHTQKKYDLIIYALTDSLMLIPGQSSLRLENYLYTLEGLTVASQHLNPNGVFTIYNYYGQRWFADRLANTLAIIYKASPCFDTYTARDYWATVLTTSFNSKALNCPTHWQSSHHAYELPSTDNHPFIYMQANTLTSIYIVGLFFITLVTLFSVHRMGASLTAIGKNVDLFLMGAAFLLLETKSVISYALLFGTTWMVNSLVFIGILVSIYLAIEVTQRVKKINVYLLYMLLSLSLLLMWTIPISELLIFTPLVRFIVATGFTFAPVFIANLIFANRLHESASATNAMGANLIGAVLGGSFEYVSLVIGYQHFSLIILGIYTAAFIYLLVTRHYSIKVFAF